MFKYITREELAKEILEKTGLRYGTGHVHSQHKGLSYEGRLPISISEHEFNYIREFIVKHNLSRGFDLATGTCVGTLACAQGLKETGGKLISMDSYIEEQKQFQFLGTNFVNMDNTDKLKRNQKVVDAFGLNDVVELKNGWFPTDFVEKGWREELGVIDFALIDCLKDAKDFSKGIEVLRENINKERFAIFVHDTHGWRGQFESVAKQLFGIEAKFLSDFKFGELSFHQHFPIALITNID